jgi:hypothetical protein
VRRAIDAVKPSAVYWLNPVTGIASWYAGHEKTQVPEADLEKIQDRWLRAKSDPERAKVARDAELLADRIEESLPGAPQDRTRTNLYEDEVQQHADATSYVGEVEGEGSAAWDWLKKKKDEATKKGSEIGTWLLVGGGALLAWKTLGYLTARAQSRVRMAAGDTERALNVSLEDAAERQDETLAKVDGYVYSLEGSSNWRSASDEDWETIVATVEGHIIGRRTIDGADVVVIEQGGGYYAALPQNIADAAHPRVAEPRDADSSHFHVMSGLAGGYMPNENQTYRTREEAEDAAREMARDFRENGEKVSGSAKQGFYTVGDHQYIEIADCDQADCLSDLDEP